MPGNAEPCLASGADPARPAARSPEEAVSAGEVLPLDVPLLAATHLGEGTGAGRRKSVPNRLPHDMVINVKATIEIDDSVMERLREEAPRRGTTMSALVEAGLRYVLAKHAPDSGPAGDLPPLPTWDSCGHLVDIDNREELYRVMEEN